MCKMLCVCLMLIGATAGAQTHDRVAFGRDSIVRAGESVNDAVSFGGDTIVEGEVRGDAVSFGGSVILRGNGSIHGDTVSFGGNVDGARRPAALPLTHHRSHAHPVSGVWHWLGDVGRSAVSYALLFLLGLLMLGVARDRLGAMQVTMIRDPAKTAGIGLLAYLASAIGIVVLAITLVGIPAAVVVALALPVATYIGLATAATVIGAALPMTRLRDRPIAQLGAGVLVLFLASLVPGVGGLLTVVAACMGLGALVRTRFGELPPRDLPTEEGPYRTAATV